MKYKIGIDVGGTFTDFLLAFPDGTSKIYKVLSTPDDPSVGLLNGISDMASDLDTSLEKFLEQVETIVHGTTVTTNAVLTYNGAKTGLLTTAGLRDSLEMRRGIREEQYNNRYTNVVPLVPRYLRRPVEERIDYQGDVVTSFNPESVEEAVELFEKEGVDSVAICFMNSFANKEHETKAARIIKEKMPDCYLSVSSSLLPSIRFYDRVSTTVLNSYVGPVLRRYLQSLVTKLKDHNFQGTLLIMQSNGGIVAPEVAADEAAVTLLSGPAAGPVAGVSYTSINGFDDCITVDMGGTSFDAALIKNKTPLVTTEGDINRLRLALPMLDIVTIGAGGGSIGWIDEGSLLRMGPQSAGSQPGPACYDQGGELPTCTDADLILGYLDADYFAGGKMKLNYERAEKAIKTHIADKLKFDLVEAAAGMYDVINVNMASGVREVSVKRGDDPRDFPLVLAGGAGPNHACMIAHELEIPVIIVPKESSIFCAAGMLMSDLKHDFVRTYSTTFSELKKETFLKYFKEMENEGKNYLRSEGIPENRIKNIYALEMRYTKQYHEVKVEVTREDVYDFKLDGIARQFHKKHNLLYGYSLEEENTPIELLNIRLTSIGDTEKPAFIEEKHDGEDPSKAFKRYRKAYLPTRKEFAELPVFDGFGLKHGNRITGPAIIEQVNTTTFLTSEYTLLVDRYGSFMLFLKDREEEYARRIFNE